MTKRTVPQRPSKRQTRRKTAAKPPASAAAVVTELDETQEDERVQLAKAACIFLGFDESDVKREPGGFVNATLEALSADIEVLWTASIADDGMLNFSGPLHNLSRRLSTAREVGPLIERILAKEAVQTLTKFEAEHEAAGHQVTATSVALRAAQIRDAFPGLETEVQS